MEGSGEDAIRRRNDLNEVPTSDLDRGHLVGRQADEIGELGYGSDGERSRNLMGLAIRTRHRMTDAWPMMSRSSWQRSSSKMTGSRRTVALT